MEIGVFSRTYPVADLEVTYRRMRAHGIRRTQLNLSNAGLPTLPDALPDAEIRRIRALSAEYQISIDALSGTFNMIDPDADARLRGCRRLAVQCEIAGMLGIPVVTLCTGSRSREGKWTWHDDNLQPSAWVDLMRSTEGILPFAERHGVVLGVETEVGNVINTAERARAYLDRFKSAHLKIVMDGANLFLPHQIPRMRDVLDGAFALLSGDIALAHAKDIPRTGEGPLVALGRGALDFDHYVRLLSRAGYAGALIMHGLSEQQVPESRDFLKGVVANAGSSM